jgi:spore coat polysaccharide biosynthesis predicted glycosyltransferase SpsG
MNKILFRCESSLLTGTGHVTRSFALAEEFALNGWEVTFSGEFDEPKWILDFLHKIDNVLIEKTSEIIQRNKNYEIIVFDSYNLESKEVSILSTFGKLKISIVDGVSPIIPANIYVSTLPASYLPQFKNFSKCLFGPEYALIRRELRIRNEGAAINLDLKEKKTIGLFSGGSANVEFLEIILSQITTKLSGWNIKIFAESLVIKDTYKKNVNLKILSPRPDFSDDLHDVNLVISSASVSSWEFLSMEVPLAVYGIYKNQKSVYDFIVNSGYAEGLGFFENYKDFKIDEDNLERVIKNLLSYKSGQNKLEKKIDSNGPNRIYKEVLRLI